MVLSIMPSVLTKLVEYWMQSEFLLQFVMPRLQLSLFEVMVLQMWSLIVWFLTGLCFLQYAMCPLGASRTVAAACLPAVPGLGAEPF